VSVRKVLKKKKKKILKMKTTTPRAAVALHSCSMLYAVAAAAAEGNQGRARDRILVPRAQGFSVRSRLVDSLVR
jgi:hypothetical protein